MIARGIDDADGARLERLVREAQAGDRQAFRALVEPYLAKSLTAAVLASGSRHDGEDVLQDALVSAWRGLGNLRSAKAFPAWFRVHVVRAGWKRARANRSVVDIAAATDMAADFDVDAVVERRDLGRAFLTLKRPDRVLLVMHYFWRLPIRETAATLGIAEGTVKSRLFHAAAKLRAAYDAETRR